jgi:hypothetical protein
MPNETHNIIFERTIRSSALVSLPLTKRRSFPLLTPISLPPEVVPHAPEDPAPEQKAASPPREGADPPTRFSLTPIRRHADTFLLPLRSEIPHRALDLRLGIYQKVCA